VGGQAAVRYRVVTAATLACPNEPEEKAKQPDSPNWMRNRGACLCTDLA
jgi:hypothetical protein